SCHLSAWPKTARQNFFASWWFPLPRKHRRAGCPTQGVLESVSSSRFIASWNCAASIASALRLHSPALAPHATNEIGLLRTGAALTLRLQVLVALPIDPQEQSEPYQDRTHRNGGRAKEVVRHATDQAGDNEEHYRRPEFCAYYV